MFKYNSSFIVAYAKDVQKTHAFYKQLGAEIIKLENDKVVVKIGDYEIHFVKDTAEPWDEYKYIANLQNPGNGMILYLEVNSIQESLETVKNAEGKIVTAIKENWWDGIEFLFEDPNGFKFVFYQMK